MLRAIPSDLSAELITALEDLNALSASLLINFTPAPFPLCSSLARSIRALLSPGDSLKTSAAETLTRARIMLRDIEVLQLATAGLRGMTPELTARIRSVQDTLLAHLESLPPADAELIAAWTEPGASTGEGPAGFTAGRPAVIFRRSPPLFAPPSGGALCRAGGSRGPG